MPSDSLYSEEVYIVCENALENARDCVRILGQGPLTQREEIHAVLDAYRELLEDLQKRERSLPSE